jgi:hypothetical protein
VRHVVSRIAVIKNQSRGNFIVHLGVEELKTKPQL